MPEPMADVAWRAVFSTSAALWIVLLVVGFAVSTRAQAASVRREGAAANEVFQFKSLSAVIRAFILALVLVTAIAQIQAYYTTSTLLGAIIIGAAVAAVPLMVSWLFARQRPEFARVTPKLLMIVPLVVVSSVSLFLMRN